MSELKKKFYEYFKECHMDIYITDHTKRKLAHELAEIAEKHYDLYDDLIADKDYAIKELKKKLELKLIRLRGLI